MSSTITGSSTIGLTLSVNPTTITGSIETTLSDAVDGAATQDWTVVNSGLVESTGDLGFRLLGSADVANTGTILGKYEGVYIRQSGIITNAGTIEATGNYGSAVLLTHGGTVTNAVGGNISGRYGVRINGTGSILNQGTLLATGTSGSAAYLTNGLIQNAAGGVISGPIGVDLLGAGSIVNAGTISTTQPGGTAINLGSGTSNTLVIDPGSTIIGAIAQFAARDVIDFANIALSGESFANGGLTLSSGGNVVATLSLAGDLDNSEFTLSSDGAGGSRITLGLDAITANTTGGETLTAPSTSIAAGVTVAGPTNGVYGGNYGWSLANSGTIIGGGSAGDAGIDLPSAVLISNAAGGLVEGYIGVRLGNGTLIDAGTIASSVNDGIAIDLIASPNNVSLVLDPGAVLVGAIAGFVTGDVIDLAQTSITSETFANGVLTLSNGGVEVAALTLAGSFNTPEFGLTPDGAGGTAVRLNATQTNSGIYTTGISLSALTTTIAASAQINTFGTAVTGAYGRDWTLVNAGQINASPLGFEDQGVNLVDGQLTNTSTALIRGYTGVEQSGGRFINDGHVQGLGNYGYGFIDFGTGIYLLNARGGVISGGRGMFLNNATAQNAGQIIAYSPTGVGVNIGGNTSFNNTGSVTAATGILLETGSNASNSGTIIATGGSYYYAQSFKHVGLRLGAGNFSNAAHGVIEGPTGATITSGNLRNAGTIMGISGAYYNAGYGVSKPFLSEGAVISGGTVTNTATGKISGVTGVRLLGGVLVDAGIIASTATTGSSIAIDFGTKAATLILDPTAIVQGVVESFGLGDIIELPGIGAGATLTTFTDAAGDVVASIGGGSKQSVARDITFAGSGEFALLQIAGGAELLGDTTIIGNGETASGGTIGAGYELLVLSGGVDTGSTILPGGAETVSSGGTVYVKLGVTPGLTLSVGSTEIVSEGVTISGATVASGVTLVVDGTADGTVVNSGGRMVVAAGGVAGATTVGRGGTETVLAGGATYITSAAPPGLKLSAGSREVIGENVTVTGANIAAGITLDVWGTASALKVSKGGMAFIYPGGSVVNGNVLGGGLLTVSSGATVSGGLTVSGGTALVYGSLTSGTNLTFAGPGGSLEWDSTGFAGAIKGFGAGDLIDFINLPFSTGTYAFKEAANNKSGVLSLAEGGQQIKLTLDGNYTTANFTVSSGPMGGSLLAFTPSNSV